MCCHYFNFRTTGRSDSQWVPGWGCFRSTSCKEVWNGLSSRLSQFLCWLLWRYWIPIFIWHHEPHASIPWSEGSSTENERILWGEDTWSEGSLWRGYSEVRILEVRILWGEDTLRWGYSEVRILEVRILCGKDTLRWKYFVVRIGAIHLWHPQKIRFSTSPCPHASTWAGPLPPLWTSTRGRHEVHTTLLKRLLQWPTRPKAQIRIWIWL